MGLIDLIIPTYNRPKFLERILEYYNYYKVNFNIIIVDSSGRSKKRQNKKVVSLYPNLNILYIDKFPQNLPSHIKYAKMLNYAKSKYVCFCPDDDFIVPNGINEAVKFLEKNPDYSAAHGSYISFYVYSGPFNSKEFWWKFIYAYKSIISSNPRKRFISHLTDYYQVLWAVRRTDIVRVCYKEFLKSKVDPYLFGELLPDMLTLIYGKMKRLSTFYSARQAFSTSYGYWPSLFDSIKAGTYQNEYLKFKNCLAKNLAKFGFTKNKSLSVIDLSMNTYLKTTMQEHLMGRVNLLLKFFPSFLRTAIRLLHAKYLFSKKVDDRIGLINNLSSKYFKDFEIIRQLVLNYNIKHDI